ncbi:MAG: hypothetical protein F6K23_36310 [Okeania sp. SIO2C9]|uniref:hypothetical protein n=1 Tax=Okeania sp. SIO2C9 TaxID=2607791 RepID=UPI0013C04DE1|nr:hypothetical protein [Okeania sp. SIO2C9]NEQ77992.1 hypothetical protein [Okeania sp. SIO2C9]
MLRQNNLIHGSYSTFERERKNSKTKKLVLKTLIFTIICGDALFLTGAIGYHLYNKWVIANQPIYPTENSSISPTEIPWLKTKEECEHTGRIWQEEKCLDSEHNHLF